ncbi:hypothetical protein ENBRE01_1183 [Enteropsectra breve]|nr:hypothetical protein ENBRE01_1183 [Enteropsectra breve]
MKFCANLLCSSFYLTRLIKSTKAKYQEQTYFTRNFDAAGRIHEAPVNLNVSSKNINSREELAYDRTVSTIELLCTSRRFIDAMLCERHYTPAWCWLERFYSTHIKNKSDSNKNRSQLLFKKMTLKHLNVPQHTSVQDILNHIVTTLFAENSEKSMLVFGADPEDHPSQSINIPLNKNGKDVIYNNNKLVACPHRIFFNSNLSNAPHIEILTFGNYLLVIGKKAVMEKYRLKYPKQIIFTPDNEYISSSEERLDDIHYKSEYDINGATILKEDSFNRRHRNEMYPKYGNENTWGHSTERLSRKQFVADNTSERYQSMNNVGSISSGYLKSHEILANRGRSENSRLLESANNKIYAAQRNKYQEECYSNTSKNANVSGMPVKKSLSSQYLANKNKGMVDGHSSSSDESQSSGKYVFKLRRAKDSVESLNYRRDSSFHKGSDVIQRLDSLNKYYTRNAVNGTEKNDENNVFKMRIKNNPFNNHNTELEEMKNGMNSTKEPESPFKSLLKEVSEMKELVLKRIEKEDAWIREEENKQMTSSEMHSIKSRGFGSVKDFSNEVHAGHTAAESKLKNSQESLNKPGYKKIFKIPRLSADSALELQNTSFLQMKEEPRKRTAIRPQYKEEPSLSSQSASFNDEYLRHQQEIRGAGCSDSETVISSDARKNKKYQICGALYTKGDESGLYFSIKHLLRHNIYLSNSELTETADFILYELMEKKNVHFGPGHIKYFNSEQVGQ